MSRKYKHGEKVPSDVLAKRLDELSDAITKGKDATDREFTMRIPAELDRDADLVLGASAERIMALEQRVADLQSDNKRLGKMKVGFTYPSEEAVCDHDWERVSTDLKQCTYPGCQATKKVECEGSSEAIATLIAITNLGDFQTLDRDIDEMAEHVASFIKSQDNRIAELEINKESK